MWVTQTYLGANEPDAKLFVYYLFEDYVREQQAFTRSVQHELEDLGEMYGSSVSLLMPNKRYAAKIGAEMRGVEGLWHEVRGKLPGLLISTQPLSEFKPSSTEFTIIPFTSLSPSDAAAVVNKARRLLDDQLQWNYASAAPMKRESMWQRFVEALELKPGVAGIRIDLKKLASRK